MSEDFRIEAADPFGEVLSRLIASLSVELAAMYPEDKAAGAGEFEPADATGPTGRFVIAWPGDRPVGCAALRQVGPSVVEFKRLYVEPDARSRGISHRLLAALESYARGLGYNRAIAETGLRQPRSLSLLQSTGYKRIANYGCYVGNPFSACFEKLLTTDAKEIHPMQYSEYMAMTQRDDNSFSNSDLVAAYEQGIEELRSAVAGMTPEHLLARPIAGKWSTQEVVSHLADTEIYYTDRIERTIALERPLLIGVDERPYSERLRYQAFDMTEQLDLFTALRRHASRILRMQPTETWHRTAVHSETGLVTLRQLVFQAARHVRHHIPFIAEKRAVLEEVKV